MRRWLGIIGGWIDTRVHFRQVILPIMRHPVPRALAGPEGWWYVFGSAALTLFMVQIVTGIGLALVYVPVADQAYESLEYLNYQQPLGWFLRSLHNTGATAMVVLVVIHMTQVFLHGAFKYPREMTWLIGVGLLVLTLGMAFTGQVLRWDEDAYWGVGVGAAMMGRVPLIGPDLVKMVIGGPVIGGDTLSRFFSLHVFIIPGLLIGLLAVHLWLVITKGISEPPVPGEKVSPQTYEEKYEKQLEKGVPFFPDVFWKDLAFSGALLTVLVIVSAIVGPSGPTAPPDPANIPANPRPDWYFLWLFALLALSPPAMETVIMLVLPVVLVGILLLVPFVANRGEKAPSRRPMAVVTVIVIFVVMGTLTWLGYIAPWSPVMDAWSADPVPENIVERNLAAPDKPLQLMGAAVLQHKNCRNCHALEGIGGHRGPDLTDVGARLNTNELIRQVTQGGGNMPAYGDQLKPAEVEALVSFLHSLRPAGEAPAK